MKADDATAFAAVAHERAVGEKLGDIQINILIKMNHGLMFELLGRTLAPYGISAAGYIAMMAIYGSADNLVNPSVLSDATGETRGNMTRICDDLVNHGFMRRVPNLEDRRRVDLSLTEEGMALLRTVVPILRQGAASVFEVFSDKEKATLVSLLTRLHQALAAKV